MSSDGGVEYDAHTFLDEAVLESTTGPYGNTGNRSQGCGYEAR